MSVKQQFIPYDDNSKKIIDSTASRNKKIHSGVTDFGNLFQFAPYEGGYCFLIIYSYPNMGKDEGWVALQNEFVTILERDFRSLSGIDDKTIELLETGPSSAPFSTIGKNGGLGTSNISISVMERTGTPVSKYISKYHDRVKSKYSQYKNYGPVIGFTSNPYHTGLYREVFNMIYVITDSTCYNVEKAFFLFNCIPMNTPYSDLFNTEKGNISTHDISINFTCTVRESRIANRIAKEYLDNMIRSVDEDGKINVNSYEYDWSISGIDGGVSTISNIPIRVTKKGNVKFNNKKSADLIGSLSPELEYNGLKYKGD